MPAGFSQGHQTPVDDHGLVRQLTHEDVTQSAFGARCDVAAFKTEWPDGGQRIISEWDHAWPNYRSFAVLGRTGEGV